MTDTEKELNAWRELGEEMGRVISLMDAETFADWFPDWFGPRLFNLQVSASALPASASPSKRLLELATVQASEKHHQWTAGIGWDVADNHVAPMKTCPHPDCVLVRASASPGSGEPDSILDVKLWIHEWCQRNGYPGGTAAIGVDGATELLRCDRLARIDSGRTMTLAEASALPASEGQEPPADGTTTKI